MSIAQRLAEWAVALAPSEGDLALAQRSLVDTLAVALAARDESIVSVTADEPAASRWAAIGHFLDFDDLHLTSTAHISVVCVPAVLAVGGSARHYLAAAGVMARIGELLGWRHYSAGWHTTCTSGALGAAVGAGLGLGLDAAALAQAMALAVPAAGGVQRAFGSMSKPLQVGFASGAGVRAAYLVAGGATADPAAVDHWVHLVADSPGGLTLGDEVIPGGLAIKLYPCCYALQRPITAGRELRRLAGSRIDPSAVRQITVRAPESTLQPLIHHRPSTGLQAKFSLEYAIAATLIDDDPGFASFSDAAVARPAAQQLLATVRVDSSPRGDGLLAGSTELVLEFCDATSITADVGTPPGAPGCPLSEVELKEKVRRCAPNEEAQILACGWQDAPQLLAAHFPARQLVGSTDR